MATIRDRGNGLGYKPRQVSTRGIPYELDEDAFNGFKLAVKNGQQRLALEYAVVLFDSIFSGSSEAHEAVVDVPSPQPEPEQVEKPVARKSPAAKKEVVDDGDTE